MNLLDRYVARTLLAAVALVMGVLVTLGLVFYFIGEQRAVGVGHYGALEALSYSAMNLPDFALQSFPAGALIGALLGIGVLARSQELTVMRVSGMSKLRLIRSVLLSASILIVIAMLIGEFLAEPMEQLADEQKAFDRYQNISFAGAGGAWLRSGDTILNVQGRSSEAEFGSMLVFELGPDNRLLSVGRAQHATAAGTNSWQLLDYAESRFGADSVSSQHVPQRLLSSAGGSDILQLAVTDPNSLALHTLYAAILYLRANSLDAHSYLLAFWSHIARMAGIVAALLFALPFGFGSMRAVSFGGRATLGLALGLAYFFLQRLVESGAQVYQLSPVVIAWVPTALLMFAALVFNWRIR
jgi:lipopolysaccharide export system permease protein